MSDEIKPHAVGSTPVYVAYNESATNITIRMISDMSPAAAHVAKEITTEQTKAAEFTHAVPARERTKLAAWETGRSVAIGVLVCTVTIYGMNLVVEHKDVATSIVALVVGVMGVAAVAIAAQGFKKK